MSSSDHDERRSDYRVRVALPAAIIRGSGAESVEMLNASYRGLFLRMKWAPPVRELVKLRIRLPTRELEIHAVAVRVVDEPTGLKGVGLRFFAFNGQDRVDWEQFIAKALPARNLRAA